MLVVVAVVAIPRALMHHAAGAVAGLAWPEAEPCQKQDGGPRDNKAYDFVGAHRLPSSAPALSLPPSLSLLLSPPPLASPSGPSIAGRVIASSTENLPRRLDFLDLLLSPEQRPAPSPPVPVFLASFWLLNRGEASIEVSQPIPQVHRLNASFQRARPLSPVFCSAGQSGRCFQLEGGLC